MILRRMLRGWFKAPTDDELKAAARRRLALEQAELARQGIRVEMATERTIEEIERDLRRHYQERTRA